MRTSIQGLNVVSVNGAQGFFPAGQMNDVEAVCRADQAPCHPYVPLLPSSTCQDLPPMGAPGVR